ncbi:MAG TPA: M42 family peptidase [Candidatus Altiarchaeales archaeon]|nr:M42 family peptidase [Candidatus Altiarchaeales archaeon]
MDLMEKLCRASGVSGFEGGASSLMMAELKKCCDTVLEDNIGNIIAVKGSGKPVIKLAAHVDEVGFVVKHITKEGYLYFVKVGGIDDRILLDQRVIVKGRGDVVGIIGAKPPHMLSGSERKKVVKHDEMFIDIGAKNKKDAEKRVSVGDPIVFEPNYGVLNGKIFYGKAVDDRIGCYALIEIMKKIPKNLGCTVYAVATTQEEVGLKGARVAAYRINPDFAIAVDTTLAGDMPGVTEKESDLKIGKGPAITILEASGRGVISHPKLRSLMEKTAKAKKIPVQIDVLEGGMTDAAIIYMTREGIPSTVVSIPTRYIHGSSGVFHMDDVENSVKLVLETIKALAKKK